MSEPEVFVYDRNAEISTIAACLSSKTARDEARKHISGGDFYDPAHEAIWDVMSRLDRQGKGVDPATLLSALQTSSPHAAQQLPNLVTWPAFADNVADYAETVREW